MLSFWRAPKLTFKTQNFNQQHHCEHVVRSLLDLEIHIDNQNKYCNYSAESSSNRQLQAGLQVSRRKGILLGNSNKIYTDNLNPIEKKLKRTFLHWTPTVFMAPGRALEALMAVNWEAKTHRQGFKNPCLRIFTNRNETTPPFPSQIHMHTALIPQIYASEQCLLQVRRRAMCMQSIEMESPLKPSSSTITKATLRLPYLSNSTHILWFSEAKPLNRQSSLGFGVQSWGSHSAPLKLLSCSREHNPLCWWQWGEAATLNQPF